MEAMMANNQTGKGKKARHRLNAINEEIKEIKKQLDKARATLEKTANPGSKDEKKKRRSMVVIAPPSVSMKVRHLPLEQLV